MSRTLVIIPTYNERESLPRLLERLWASKAPVDVLVVDDGSPDGTADWVANEQQTRTNLHLIRRPGKSGLGSAYLHGFSWGIERGYEYLVEMDADGSHPPETLPRMLAAVDASDLAGAVGSRWVAGGRTVNWPKRREWLSRAANRYAAFMLGLPVKDSTGGYRVYRSRVIAELDTAAIVSRGYCFQIDLTRRIYAIGERLIEIPIEFREREFGASKMSADIIVEAMVKVTQWGFERLLPWRRAALTRTRQSQ